MPHARESKRSDCALISVLCASIRNARLCPGICCTQIAVRTARCCALSCAGISGENQREKKQESEVDFGCPELCEELKNAETEYETADRNHKVQQHSPLPTAHAHARSAHTHCFALYAARPLRQTAPLFFTGNGSGSAAN